MRPGERRIVTLTLLNGGPGAANIMLTISAAVMGNDDIIDLENFLQYTIFTPTPVLEGWSSTEVRIEIVLTMEATGGQAVTFTVVAESDTGDDNFATFLLITTSSPIPEFTENVS